MPSCEWRECSATLDSDEALYEHLCSAHYDNDSDAPGGDRTECRWKDCSVRPKGGKHYVFKHLITHTDWRPFVCPEQGCDKRYARDSALKEHIGLKHRDRARAKSLAPAPPSLHATKVPKHRSGTAAPVVLEDVKTGGATMSCEWCGCTASGFTTPEQLSDHLLTAHAPTANGTCLWPSCNGKWFRPQNFSRHLRSAHAPSWYKPFACTASGCGRTFKELGAMRHHVGYAHEGGKLKRKRGGVKVEVEDEWLSALSEDEDEPTPAPPTKRPRWPREPSFDSDSENKDDLRAKRIVELEDTLKTQSTRLQVAEKKMKTLQKQLADVRKAAKATATVAETLSGSTAAKMEQREVASASAPGELEQDEWTMWVDGVM